MSDTESDCVVYEPRYAREFNFYENSEYPDDEFEEMDIIYEEYEKLLNENLKFEKLPISELYGYIYDHYNLSFYEYTNFIKSDHGELIVITSEKLKNMFKNIETKLSRTKGSKLNIEYVLDDYRKCVDNIKYEYFPDRKFEEKLKNIISSLEKYSHLITIDGDYEDTKTKIDEFIKQNVKKHPLYIELLEKQNNLEKMLDEIGIGNNYEDFIKNINFIYNNKEEFINYINMKQEKSEISISRNSSVPDYFTDYLFSESEEEKQIRLKKEKEIKDELLRKKINKNILKSKLINIFSELKDNKDKIIEEKNKKENILRKKLNINKIKAKCISSLKELNNDSNKIYKIIEKIKINKKIVFDNITINNSAINSNRSSMKFLSDLYEEKEIKKTLSNKDFMLAVNEFHSDKNSTRMNHLCKIIYNLRKNDIIWNSNIIFKHIYSFQYIKDYQIEYLLLNIERICKS